MPMSLARGPPWHWNHARIAILAPTSSTTTLSGTRPESIAPVHEAVGFALSIGQCVTQEQLLITSHRDINVGVLSHDPAEKQIGSPAASGGPSDLVPR
jgi:hypothetical protein